MLGRAHRRPPGRRGGLPAARCAVWIGINLASRARWGAPAAGWPAPTGSSSARAGECVEQGYLLIPADLRARGARGPRGRDRDRGRGDAHRRAIRRRGPPGDRGAGPGSRPDPRTAARRKALALIDEAMVAVTTDDLSPIVERHRLLRRDPRLPGRPTSCGAPRSGPRRCAPGATRSRTWSPSPAAASCTARRSSRWTAPGREALEEAQRAGERCLEGREPAGRRRGGVPAG